MSELFADRSAIPGYEILRRVGAGGMGDVFLANQSSFDRQVVIKTVNVKSPSCQEELTRRFDREAELTADIAHPNIVEILDRGIYEGQPFLVMEYIDGASLRQRLQPGVAMPVEQARPMLCSIVQALSCLHEHGILHRDLKPENVLLDARGRVKVADFGVAVSTTEIGSITQCGQFVGTIDYMAPEQRHRLGSDERADQFSLAVMAYEMLTGHKPLGIFKQPSDKNTLLNPAVDAVILRALEEDPNDRYSSVRQFGEMLDRALTGVTERRIRWWPFVLAAAIGIAILSQGYIWLRAGAPPPQAGSVDLRKDAGHKTEAPNKQSTEMPPPFALAPFSADDARQHQRHWAEHLNTTVVQEDSIGIRLVLIPPGTFVMGSSQELVESVLKSRKVERDRWYQRLRSEAPQHKVEISKPFWIGATEVTVGQFRNFVEAAEYRTTREGQFGWGLEQGKWVRAVDYSWQDLGELMVREDAPVVNVSFDDAMAFCDWLGKLENQVYRLPTEAEWEYACRSGSGKIWTFDNESELLDSHSWFHANSDNRMHPVAQKAPNAFGLFDMQGNVSEWCLDWYGNDYYASLPVKDPSGPSSGAHRVLRGGAFSDRWHQLRPTTRDGRGPMNAKYSYGFRVVRMLPESSS